MMMMTTNIPCKTAVRLASTAKFELALLNQVYPDAWSFALIHGQNSSPRVTQGTSSACRNHDTARIYIIYIYGL